MKLKSIYEEIKTDGTEKYYHGTPNEHQFDTSGYMANGTFFSKSKDVARHYGKFVYEVTLKSGLKIFDVLNREDVADLMSEFPELYDTYYNEDEEGYLITTPEQLMNSSDPWKPIEDTDGVLDYLNDHYDGARILEGGAEDNLLLFSPVKDKMLNVGRI